MTIGKINWFGGFNNKTGKINQYGFITVLENDKQKDIHFAAKDVSVDLHPLLQAGTYVECEVMQNEKGRESAFNIKLTSAVGIINWYEDGRGYITCEDRPDIRLESREFLYAGDIIFFYIKYNPKYDKDEAYHPQKVNKSTNNQTIIEKCLQSKQIEIRKLGITGKYNVFFTLIDKFNESNYKYCESLSISWKEIYKFDQLEENLVERWCSNKTPFQYAQMLSARGAEKLALMFYRNLGYAVEDISIHQVTGQTNIWLKGDIRIDSQQLIDVKNARTSVNSNTYSEFCIPTFKQERGNDVTITAVLSPYLSKEFMDGNQTPKFSVINPLLLGECNRAITDNLESFFNNHFLITSLSRDMGTSAYLPPWLFDYSRKFYTNQNKLKDDFLKLAYSDIPEWEDILITKVNSIPLFIASKKSLPKSWSSQFDKWKIDFINSLIGTSVENISLPYLFLSILNHFIKMLRTNRRDYSPQQYIELLYTNYRHEHPLKIYDPLNLIQSFCKTLQELWEVRHTSNLISFQLFKFNGRGLLQGKRDKEDTDWTTIMAYCGGWIEKKGKCGYRPLVIGKHKTCYACGKLICPKEDCGYCSDKCEGHLQRKLDEDF
jgi:cold shock CspA family protein